MGIKLSNVLGATASTSIDFGGDAPLEVTYRPGAVTPASLARIQGLSATDDGASIEMVAVLVAFLADVLVSWNLLDEDDQPLGCDAATIESLPVEFLARVFSAINGGDQSLGEAVAS